MFFYFARFTRIINGLPTFPRAIPTSQASQIQRICGVQLNGKALIYHAIDGMIPIKDNRWGDTMQREDEWNEFKR